MMNNRPGDWNCRSCFHLNFQRRDSCQRCGDPKPVLVGQLDHYAAATFGALRASSGVSGSSNSPFGFSIGPDVRPGDWYCTVGNCGAHNFASRSSCFKCGAFKLDHADSPATGFDAADMARGRSGFGAAAFAAFSSPGNIINSRSSWKSGDWICTRSGCNEHNFASRMECFRCNAPRVDSTTMTSSSYF
ncbi:RNA-binding protein involved in heterochromatin assembly dri1-like [Impatiens glandulifera]|uniref:RNA-binding protein involved in heterochromatin assembly dri1-like n=1 Tax=Impatiens glandulifera TaxID=253017 RepID=UPI001FB0CCB5|nr:RNA-binding protein involved in heterochromatin assembly dri1-like [Impatiens glandulifera]XP_047328544.1 RNA-binding protein involved in heterochromatin assembly dri1-like [Impatiens glandulifera]